MTLSDKQVDIFYVHLPTDRIAHMIIFDRPVVDHWLEWKISEIADAPDVQSRLDDQNLNRRVLYWLSYILLPLLVSRGRDRQFQPMIDSNQ